MFKKTVLILVSVIISLFLGEFLAQKYLMKSQVVKIIYKGDGINKNSHFITSKDNVLVYELRKLPHFQHEYFLSFHISV